MTWPLILQPDGPINTHPEFARGNNRHRCVMAFASLTVFFGGLAQSVELGIGWENPGSEDQKDEHRQEGRPVIIHNSAFIMLIDPPPHYPVAIIRHINQ